MPAILIYCEGSETEPNYLRGLCRHLGINPAAVRIKSGEGATDPKSLVRLAQKDFTEDGGFDLVYVICDGDTGRVDEARELATKKLKNSAGDKTNVRVIASHPSFEYWLLLHFEYRARPCSAAEAIRDLRAHLTGYDKAEPQIFEMVEMGLDRACQHAERLKRDLQASGANTPDTDMASLVSQLREAKLAANK
jgi:RloB-like protein